MNSFYTCTVLLLLMITLIGYKAGFVRIILLAVLVAVPLIATIYLYPSFAALIIDQYPSFTNRATSIAAITIFISLLLLLMIFLMVLRKRVTLNHTAIFNSMAGAITGLIGGCFIMAAIIRFTDVVVAPQYVESSIKQYGFSNWIDPVESWMHEKMPAFFQQPSSQVLASANAGSVTHEAGVLLYVTNDFTRQADMEEQLFQLVNEARAMNGLTLLTRNESLDKVAALHAADMFQRGYFSHDTPEGITPFQRLHKANVRYVFAGENLAMAATVSRAHDELMNSPGHRANILNRSFGHIGIAVLQSAEHGLMVTQEFSD